MKAYKHIYFLGIGGIGMSALARWFNSQHTQVFGYDRTATPLTDQLTQEGITIHFEDRIECIPHEILKKKAASLIVYTPAIPSHHQILNYLINDNYTIYKRSAVLGMLSQAHFTIAVAGTHGKTTTSAMIAHLLYTADKPMVAFLGGVLQGYHTNLLIRGKHTQATLAVVEADEFDRSFLRLYPDYGIVTAVDADHLDIYGEQSALEDAFKTFIQRVPVDGKLILQKKAAQLLLVHDKYGPRIVEYALAEGAIRAAHLQIGEHHFCFDYVSKEVTIKEIKLAIPGYHNVENALAAITACLYVGLSPEVIRQGLATFKGIKRRFEYIIRQGDLIFIDDYAHHPVEITALLHSIKRLYSNKKVTVVFQPHLYSRTQDFAAEFAQSLGLADEVYLLAIYPAREAPIQGVTSKCIWDRMSLERKFLCDKENLLPLLKQNARLEVLVTIGAGDIDTLVQPIKRFLLDALQ